MTQYSTQKDGENIQFTYAIQNQDLPIIRHFLTISPHLSHQKDEFNSTPLHHAARIGSTTITQLLLQSGASTDLRTQEGWERRTPLEVAIDKGHAHVVGLLLDVDENLINERRVKSNEYETEWIAESLLHRAAVSGYAGVVEMVLGMAREKVSIEERDSFGRTPLLCALWGETRGEYGTDWDRTERRKAAMVFVHAGADLSVRDTEGNGVFVGAARVGCVDLIETLLTAGWDVNENRGSLQSTALHLAAQGKHLNIAEILLKHGAEIDARDERGCFPLHLAIASRAPTKDEVARSVEMIDFLVHHGAWIDAKDNAGETPLHRTLKALDGSEAVVKKLLEHGAAVNTQSSDLVSGTPLHAALSWAYSGRVSLPLLLTHDSTNPNIRDLRGLTPLHRACQEGKVDAVAVFLGHRGVDLEARDMGGRTAIMMAAWVGSRECMVLLGDAGAERTGRDCDGNGLEYYIGIGERKRAEKRQISKRGRGRGGGSLGKT